MSSTPMPDPTGVGSVLDNGAAITSQAQALPDNSQAPQAPMTAASPDPTADYPASPDQGGPVPQGSQPDPDAGSSTHGWRAVLRGALSGLENHLKGAGEGLLTGGIPGAVAGAVSPGMADRAMQYRQQTMQAELQQRQAQAASAQQNVKFSAEAHDANMAAAHVNLVTAQNAYDLSPKSVQDVVDRQEQLFAGQLNQQGYVPVRSGLDSMTDANNIALAMNQVDGDSQFGYVPLRTADGAWAVYHIATPGKLLSKDAELPLLKLDGSVTSIPVRAGSMTVAQFANLYTQRVTDIMKQQNAAAGKIEVANATGLTARNQGAANKSNATANAAPKVENFVVGSLPTGEQVAGTAQDLQAAGATGITKLPAAEASKVVVARELTAPNGLFSSVAADLAALNALGKLNAATSRWNEFMTGTVGAGDPLYTKLRTDTQLLSTAIMQAHVGSRGSESMLDHFKGLANAGKMDAPTLTAALQAEFHYVKGKALLPPKKVGQ